MKHVPPHDPKLLRRIGNKSARRSISGETDLAKSRTAVHNNRGVILAHHWKRIKFEIMSTMSGNETPPFTRPAAEKKDWKRIGEAQYNALQQLGTGWNDTKVYRGEFRNREVAVKKVHKHRMPAILVDEIILLKPLSHPNILKYLYMKSDDDFVYLVFELYIESLSSYMNWENMSQIPKNSSKEIIRQITEGLEYIHFKNIVHCNLNPKCVHVAKGESGARIIISDFIDAKIIDPEYSHSRISEPLSHHGWIAREQDTERKTSFQSDIFSLGNIIYYVLTKGTRPYGEIATGEDKCIIRLLQTEDAHLAAHLIYICLSPNQTDRPSASAILNHPFLWGAAKRIQFFSEVSDQLMRFRRSGAAMPKNLQNMVVIKNHWKNYIDTSILKTFGKGEYHFNSVHDLLRAIRNLKKDYSKLSDEIQSVLGGRYEMVSYFTRKFPDLLLHTFTVMKMYFDANGFKAYYGTTPSSRLQRTVQYDENNILGDGSQRTTVFNGTFGGREVAVKRMLKGDQSMKEIELLRQTDHPHVIQYYHTEEEIIQEDNKQVPHVLIVLQLCSASLQTYVEIRNAVNDIPEVSHKEILRQTTEGLNYLHSNNIVHGNLKPKNVLLLICDSGARFVISNFGKAEKVPDTRPEMKFELQLRELETTHREKPEYPMDIFSLGCIFYFVLTNGCNPFKVEMYRSNNNTEGISSKNLEGTDECSLSTHLISLALSPTPTARPSASAILNHPFFWGAEKRIKFFADAWHEIRNEKDTPETLEDLKVINGDWSKVIDHEIATYLFTKKANYDAHSVRHLVRAIRNLEQHYTGLSTTIRTILGDDPVKFVPNKFADYFNTKFPELLLHVYKAFSVFEGMEEYYGVWKQLIQEKKY